MKKMLIAATTIGAAIAGLILYSRKRNSSTGQIKRLPGDAYKTMSDGVGKVERLGQHTMG